MLTQYVDLIVGDHQSEFCSYRSNNDLTFCHNQVLQKRLDTIMLFKNKIPTWCHLLFYFTSYVLNMFRTLIYPSSGAYDYSAELPFWSYYSWFGVCWSFGVVGLEWYPCCRLRTLIYPSSGACDYSVELPHWSIVLGSMCVGVSVWLGWSGIPVVGWSLKHGYHSKPTTPKLQHTSNQEQYDQCGNSTE